MSQKRQPEEPPAKAIAGEEKRLKIPTFTQLSTPSLSFELGPITGGLVFRLFDQILCCTVCCCLSFLRDDEILVGLVGRVVTEVMKRHNLQKFLSALEPLVRRVVKEEVETALANHLANITREFGEPIYPSTSQSLQLQFQNRISLPIFTGTRIEGEDFSVICIALVDGSTGQIVKSGPESSMKVEIVVLEGDFEGGEEENWTMEDFKNNIVREREGKQSLLSGDLSLDLNQGIGLVGELSFTDNSSWTRSRKFRLGVKVSDGCFNGTRVREARSEPFVVKDHRGELYKKHYPPALGDEVWRLERIGKDGAFHKRLSSENIITVKDFLTLLNIDTPKLRNILGSGMSAKMWEGTAEHARTCVLTTQMYVYLPNGQQKTGVVFNIVGEVMGLLSEQRFVSVNELPDNERADAQSLVRLAFDHWSDVVAYDAGAVTGNSSQAHFLTSPDNMYNPFSSPIKIDRLGYTQSSVSSPDIFSIGCIRGFDDYPLQAMDCLESSSNLVSLDSCNISRPNPLIFEECGSHSFLDEDSLQYLDPDLSLLSKGLEKDSPADLGTAVTGFFAMSARSAAREKKANTRWATLVFLLRWRFSIRRLVGSRKHKIHEGFC